ncbi:hypothetical protein HYDPIDRAFT_111969 [Hydnomerulius pinastri MD-312]|uniref:WW domain-containing protein n=1 Tax=Hydnomerulius pinastri MD-312 TaxID=994086 RepID=A0A0C9W9U4_9AGAM|nr:hypothetical protein HYDPIDRAFT_111969 [Hydnomerulius pinastri MD-312]
MESSGSGPSTLKSSHKTKPFALSPPVHTLPSGWVRIRHPESGVYYFHEEKILCTWSDVCIPRVHGVIMKAAEMLQKSSAFQDVPEDQEVGLVLDAQVAAEGSKTCSYYCVSHGDRRIFWLEGMGHEDEVIQCTPSKCKGLQGDHCAEAEYWKHCELFPTTFTVTKDATDDLRDILIQASGDRVTAKFSTSPYTKDDLAYMLSLVKEIEGDVREGSGHNSWVIAKFMSLHNDGILRSSYGQSDDYFDIDNSEPSPGPYRRSYLMAFLAPFLLKSPDVYAEELYTFHENFTPERWSRFVHKVDTSIRDSNLLATVLLSTNVGLLAIGSIDEASIDGSRSAVQIVTYVSIICSVGSIIIGLAIFKQYRAKGADTPLRAVTVLKRILKETYGLERLAIICSLPYILLMWSLIAFLGAFSVIFYNKTDPQVRVPVSVTLALVLLFLFSCMYTAGPPDKEDRKPQNHSYRERAAGYFPRLGPKKTDTILP